MTTHKILIVDDHKILLESLSLLVDSIDGMEVVGTLSDSRKVSSFLSHTEVDILITDMNMPYANGIDLTLSLRPSYPRLKILMLTVDDSADSIREAFQAGISGYITKKATKDELRAALHTVLKGEKFFSHDVMKELLNPRPGQQEAPPQDLKGLSTRELEVIRLIAQEYSSSEIAERLFISPGTVENHRHNILQKLGAKNSIGIIKYAIKYNLI